MIVGETIHPQTTADVLRIHATTHTSVHPEAQGLLLLLDVIGERIGEAGETVTSVIDIHIAAAEAEEDIPVGQGRELGREEEIRGMTGDQTIRISLPEEVSFNCAK